MCNTSLKLHFLHSQLDFFSENTGPISDENDESFHLDISQIERRYSGIWSPNLLADYCWSPIRETLTGKNMRRKKKKKKKKKKCVFNEFVSG